MTDLDKLKIVALDRWLIVNKCRDKKVLELGCINHSIEGIKGQKKKGTWLFDYLCKFSEKAVGLDINKKAVDFLKKEGYDVRLGDAQNFDFFREKFDVIVASKLIDHLLNLEGFLESCSKNLRMGGLLIISDDNILCLPKLVVWYFKRYLGKPHNDITVKFIPYYFKNFVSRFGFSVNEVKYFFGEGAPKILKTIDKFAPKKLIFPPLFYSWYILILKKKD